MDSNAVDGGEVPTIFQKPGMAPTAPTRRLCSLTLHDASFSSEEILVNTSLLPAESVRTGDVMQIVPVEGFVKRNSGNFADFPSDASRLKSAAEARGEDRNSPFPSVNPQAYDHLLRSEKSNIFMVTSMSQEMLSKQPSMQVSHDRISI